MRKIVQNSCSELLVDTRIYNVEEAFQEFSALFELCNWDCSPPLSKELLQTLKAEAESIDGEDRLREEVTVYDKNGNRAWVQYGDNGYITTGFRFDTDCNHHDVLCFPIFKKVIDFLDGELISLDGGSTYAYEEWDEEREDEEDYYKS